MWARRAVLSGPFEGRTAIAVATTLSRRAGVVNARPYLLRPRSPQPGVNPQAPEDADATMPFPVKGIKAKAMARRIRLLVLFAKVEKKANGGRGAAFSLGKLLQWHNGLASACIQTARAYDSVPNG